MRKIYLQKSMQGWTATFYGIAHMPEGEEILLPWSSLAWLQTVAADIRNRFPHAILFYRDASGHASHVADFR